MLTIDAEGLYPNRIRLTRGDDAVFGFSLYDPDGNVMELEEGDEVMLTIKESTSKRKALLKVPLGDDGQFHISSVDTSDWDFGSYVYDVQVTFADGSICTVIPPSKIEIKEEVSW